MEPRSATIKGRHPMTRLFRLLRTLLWDVFNLFLPLP